MPDFCIFNSCTPDRNNVRLHTYVKWLVQNTLSFYLFIIMLCISKMYIIKYFSQYTQPSVGLICHFTDYKETSVSGLIIQTKDKSTTQILNLNLLLIYCYI